MKNTKILGLLALITVFTACQNDPLSDLTVEDSQVFITNHDESVNFKQFKTFSIVDSVLIIGNQGTGTTLGATDIQFLNTVVQQMKNLGYQYVSPKEGPDVGINVAQVRNAYVNVVSQPNPYYGNYWGGGFGGGYFPGYGYGYPSSYSYVQTREAYWYLEMLDFKNPDVQNEQYNVIWNAQIRGNGLFDGVDFDTMVRSVFEQSSYLKIN
ncbi:DUF4136 domain-containing protein [Persicitalea jodogahamensis]|uniref:DUF4136 domain-containing protein n=1 Tax=Persicitalea jodogahamensis TaxID=402147 RepID=A0A8J3DCA0_9BACT|nr:DUF4136 domain-containing protein [Persicitalea jodogahamensis]GHB81463.1 hypothetical protein GCM10007390_40430 [Persicitalea jodogahamensis]